MSVSVQDAMKALESAVRAEVIGKAIQALGMLEMTTADVADAGWSIRVGPRVDNEAHDIPAKLPARMRVSGSSDKTYRKAKRVRRSAAVMNSWAMDKLLPYVKANPGQRGEQIAAALKTNVGIMRGPMKALIAAKKIVTKGQRRGMTYSVRGAK